MNKNRDFKGVKNKKKHRLRRHNFLIYGKNIDYFTLREVVFFLHNNID